ncbi:hypothetical protein TNCV_522521 [Trichonephila clavipes]|nr:hypothetical protein TNCV_522521 [Trichonephila clavipes]
MNMLDDRLHGKWKMLRWCLNVFKNIVVRHLHKSLKELLPHDQTLNSDIYCQQLNRLKLVIDQKWPGLANRRGVVFHQDNAMPVDSSETLGAWLGSFNAFTI